VTVKGLAAEFGTEAGIVDSWIRNSAHAKAWAARMLARELTDSAPDSRVAVWGLAYKQDTHSVKNSAALELIRAFPRCRFRGYDPAARLDAGIFPNLEVCDSALGALAGADALVVMTPWREFSLVPTAEVGKRLGGKLLIDPYGALHSGDCAAAGLRCFQIGRPARPRC
jgi:UDPglucose 6-dehydrogenase